MPYDLGETLKKYRTEARVSVKQISDLLTMKGFKASESTIYSWENGNSQPTPGALLLMCNRYGIENILDAFGYESVSTSGNPILSQNEIDIIDKYRYIAKHNHDGKKIVDGILNREYQITEIFQKQEIIAMKENLRLIQYYYRLASAGTGQIVFDDLPTKLIEIPDIPKYKKVDYAIGVNGDSMEPLYHDDDTLLVEKTDYVDIGEIGIFIVDGQSYVKKLGDSELISLNKKYPPMPLGEEPRCLGKVIGTLDKR